MGKRVSDSVADEQPNAVDDLKKLANEFIDRFRNVENELELLKESQRDLVDEYKDKLDIKTLKAAMRVVKIEKTVSHKDTFEIFAEAVREKESI
jgi:hypothetical protein